MCLHVFGRNVFNTQGIHPRRLIFLARDDESEEGTRYKVLSSKQNPSHNRGKTLLNFKNALHDNKNKL